MLPLDQVSDRQAQAVHDGTIWQSRRVMVSADRLHCRPPRSAAMESKLEVEAVLSTGGHNQSLAA